MLEELSKIARKLGRFDTEDSLVRMLASLVTASREFIGVADLDGNALFVNDAGRDLVGLRDLEAVCSTELLIISQQTTTVEFWTRFYRLFAIMISGKVN